MSCAARAAAFKTFVCFRLFVSIFSLGHWTTIAIVEPSIADRWSTTVDECRTHIVR